MKNYGIDSDDISDVSDIDYSEYLDETNGGDAE